jgi:hypothetical protein
VRIPVNVTADSGNVTGIPANVTEGRRQVQTQLGLLQDCNSGHQLWPSTSGQDLCRNITWSFRNSYEE